MVVQSEALDLVEKLNREIYEAASQRGEATGDEAEFFTFESNGWAEAIKFAGYPVWMSECDGREWINDDELAPLEPFVRSEAKRIVKVMDKALVEATDG